MCATSCRLSVQIDPKIQSVITRAVCVLTNQGLDAALTLVTDRVLYSGRLLEFRRTSDGPTVVAKLRPFAELVLIEASEIGSQTCQDATLRTKRIEQILNLSGY